MKRISTSFIIHTFALLHAAVALVCRIGGIEDEILLTILTMAMILMICLKKRLNIEFAAASVIVANIIGYLMGNIGADILERFIGSPYAVHALSTAVTTEILGWSTALFSRLSRPEDPDSDRIVTEPYLKWILIAMAGVFAFRLGMMLLSSHTLGTRDMLGPLVRIISDSLALTTTLCLNVIYVTVGKRRLKRYSRVTRVGILVAFTFAASLLETFLVSVAMPFGATEAFRKEFPELFIPALLVQITVYCLVFMIDFAFTAKSDMRTERGKANMAQYRYMKLKQQVNPHFLFNSLNILDCLVCEEQSEKASMYIHKLAGIYRYMIKSEEDEVVPLRDELTFTQQYIDLLHIRFPDGFRVEVNVPEALLGRYVLPCALQLLIENATKHNAVNASTPLVITVEADGDHVRVCNNIVPKYGKVESTGLGLKYLRQQYLDISGKQITVEQTNKNFIVTLPLI